MSVYVTLDVARSIDERTEQSVVEFDLGNSHLFRPLLPGFDSNQEGTAIVEQSVIIRLLTIHNTKFYKAVLAFITVIDDKDIKYRLIWG